MRTKMFLALFLYCSCSASSIAAPPHSPNYCGPSVCLDISGFPSDLSVTSSTKIGGGGLILTVAGERGSTLITIEKRPGEECVSATDLELFSQDRTIRGSAFLVGPVGVECFSVSMVDSPVEDVESIRGRFPITAIWAIENSPATFWEHGYALRLGPQLRITWKDQGVLGKKGPE